MSKEKDSLVEQAKDLVGEKAILIGGGGVSNKFRVVRVKGMDGDRPVLEAPDRLREDDFKPKLGSWRLLPLKEKFKEILDIGAYYNLGGERKEIRKDDCGMFGSIYDCTVVYSEEEGEVR